MWKRRCAARSAHGNRAWGRLCRAAGPIAAVLGARSSAQTLQFNQDHYYYNGALSVANSRYGECIVTYSPSSAPQFLNVVNADTGSWLVQNEPLLTARQVGSAPFMTSDQFDLG